MMEGQRERESLKGDREAKGIDAWYVCHVKYVYTVLMAGTWTPLTCHTQCAI